VHIEGERRFDAPPAEVYLALTDPVALGDAFSVIERVEAEGPHWTLVVRTRSRRLQAQALRARGGAA
jgi:carbon monoxide dehydrogenase subunit G